MSKKSIARSLLVVGVFAMAADAASAAGVSRHSAAAPAGTRTRPVSAALPGSSGPALYTTTSVSCLAFTPLDTAWTYSSNVDDYFRFGTTSGGVDFGGSVSIPAGAVIDYIGLNTCDEAGGNFSIFIYQQAADGSYVEIGELSSTAHGATTPCAMDYNAAALGYLLASNNGSSLQLDLYQTIAAPIDGSVRFGAVELWWKASVSPAPASPSFNDVPASSPFYQYIEALKASGITGGCGDGTNFCPDQPVLRKQMATFLAKALGLAWQY